MRKYQESAIIFNKIKETSGMTDEQMSLLGVTIEKIDTAMKQCKDKGMSNKKAMQTIYKLWKYAEPKDENGSSESSS